MKSKFTLNLILISILLIPKIMAQSEYSSPLIGVGVIVSDLEKSMDFYLNVIGMKHVGEFDVDEDLGKSSGLSGGSAFDVKVLKLDDSKDANVWKLVTFKDKVAQDRSKHIQDRAGMQYITINVKSLKPFLERIEKYKVKLEGDTPIKIRENGFVLVRDPDGVFIELIGPLE